jgi:D-alanine-D-alanine ligase
MRIGVLFGGTTSERDVSIVSGSMVAKALAARGHDVVAIDTEQGLLSREQQSELMARGVLSTPHAESTQSQAGPHAKSRLESHAEILRSVDVVFLALHGGFGENGTVQGFLEILGVPYTGSDVRGSAIAMDKDLSKQAFVHAGIPTAEWQLLRLDDALPEHLTPRTPGLDGRVVVKPNREGSTVGLTVVRDISELPAAVALARRYDPEVVVERFVAGREFAVGVLDGKALAVGEIVPLRSEIFDYASKYQKGGAQETFPAPISEMLTKEAQSIAVAVHRALRLRDYCRIDLRLSADDKWWVLEANTLPGMTATSLLPQSAGAVGIAYEELCERIALSALQHAR